jgi:hypothetical protein
MPQQQERHEFKVVIEGVALSPETVLSIDQAVQTTVIHALADLDLYGHLALTPLPGSTSEQVSTGRFGWSDLDWGNTIQGLVANPIDQGIGDWIGGSPF